MKTVLNSSYFDLSPLRVRCISSINQGSTQARTKDVFLNLAVGPRLGSKLVIAECRLSYLVFLV